MRKLLLTASIWCLVFSARSQSWLTEGNSGTDIKINFIGTKDNRPLLFRINNTPAGLLDSTWQQTFFGFKAGHDMSNGSNNVAIGYLTLSSNSTGHHSTAAGSKALMANSTGSENNAFGYAALSNNISGNSNTATGNISLFSNTSGFANSAHGFGALSQSNGNYNAAQGYEALYYNQGGSDNTSIGALSCFSNFGGSYNTALGSHALFSGYGSNYNTCVGYNAGSVYTMGWNNAILGANCDVNASNRYNCIAIGQGVICTGNSQARIGNSATVSIGGYAGWSNISDGRYKKDVKDNVKGLDFIMKLHPVTYHLDVVGIDHKLHEGLKQAPNESMQKAMADKEKIVYSGFIAQDVETAAKEAGYDFSGVDKPQDKNDLYGLRYAEFVVPLVKATQEQQQTIQEQGEMIKELIRQNANLQKRMEDLEKNAGLRQTTIAADLLSVWPNPSDGKLFISINSAQKTTAVINVTDAKGAIVKREQKYLVPGDNQFNVDIKGIATGIYTVSAEWNEGRMKRSAQVMKE